jgi:hypothetical protein
MNKIKKSKLIVDGHVHLYPCYDVDKFFHSAVTNMAKLSTSRYPGEENIEKILLFTEGQENDFFDRFKTDAILAKDSTFTFKKMKEQHAITLMSQEKPFCYILRGRQIVTKEKLEVLAVASNQQIPDGLPIREVIKKIIDKKEIAVLAWGVGKWFFKRGKIIKQVIDEIKSPYLLMGDNSGRPGFWPTPKLFQQAKKSDISLINGSDPLPFAEEVKKVGSFGFAIEGDFDPAEPGKSFRDALLANPGSIYFLGSRDSAFSFFKRQLKMFLKKHLG